MKYQTHRALYYTFASQEIENENMNDAWRRTAELFGVPAEERQFGEKSLSDPTLAGLKTAEDLRLLQKCASGFGSRLQGLTENIDDGILEIKYQALLKIKQLISEQRTTPLKAIAVAYRRDSTAAVLYALQVLLRNEGRKELGYRVLSEELSVNQNSDAGIILLNSRQGNASSVFTKLSETPEMILHPEVLEELAKGNGINPATVQKSNMRIGF